MKVNVLMANTWQYMAIYIKRCMILSLAEKSEESGGGSLMAHGCPLNKRDYRRRTAQQTSVEIISLLSCKLSQAILWYIKYTSSDGQGLVALY